MPFYSRLLEKKELLYRAEAGTNVSNNPTVVFKDAEETLDKEKKAVEKANSLASQAARGL